MPSLHLFNPENDLALASGAVRYTPPAAPMHLRLAGEILPLWYASPGDRIICSGINDKWFEDTCNVFCIKDVDVYNHIYDQTFSPTPWGWSAAARTIFSDNGVPDSVLPDDDTINNIRQMSHRRTAAILCERLAKDPTLATLPGGMILAPPAQEADDISVIKTLLSRHIPLIFKAPWSSSGRGVFDTASMSEEKTRSVASDIIRRQGSVMVEEKYDDITNFALLFYCNGNDCRHWGYSTFTTTTDGRYIANRLLSDEAQRTLLSAVTGIDIDILAQMVAHALTQIIGDKYTGYLGVDMLVGRDSCGHKILDASVEINLRYTMGIVAANIARRFLHPDALAAGQATFSVLPVTKADPDDTYYIKDGRLAGGTFGLTPPNPWFKFAVNIP